MSYRITSTNAAEVDEHLEAWDQFITAVRWLARGARPTLTLSEAMEEALTNRVAEQSTLEHRGEIYG